MVIDVKRLKLQDKCLTWKNEHTIGQHTIGLRYVNVTHTIGLRHVLHGKCDTYYRTASCVTW